MVGDTEGKGVVVLNRERSSSEGGAEHSSLHGGTFDHTLEGLAGSEELLLLEDFLEDSGDNGGTGAVTEELNRVDISAAKLGKLNSFSADHSKSVSDRLDNFFEFIAFDVAVEVLLVKEVVNTDVGFGISSQDLSSLLSSLKNAELASDVLHRVVLVLFIEFSSDLLHDGVIEVSSTEVSVGVVSNNFHFVRSEPGDSDGSLGAAKINKCHVSRLLSKEVLGLVESVLEGNGGTFVDDLRTPESSNLGGIEDSLSLDVGSVRGASEDDFTHVEASFSVELLQLNKVEADNLLDSHFVSLSHLGEGERDFVSLVVLDDFVENKFLFNGKLLRTRRIETKESSGVEDSVLEVSASLGLH